MTQSLKMVPNVDFMIIYPYFQPMEIQRSWGMRHFLIRFFLDTITLWFMWERLHNVKPLFQIQEAVFQHFLVHRDYDVVV